MLRLVGVLLLLWFDECGAAVQLPQTESGGWIKIEEETLPSIICNGFDEGSTVTWSLIHPDNTTTVIGSCSPSNTSCPSSDSNFQLSRTENQESLMKINSDHRALIGTSVKCAQGTSNAATAKFLIIRSGTIAECETRKDYTTTWTLSINCRIQDAFSSNNRYSCIWYLSEKGIQVTSKTADFHPHSTETGYQHISGYCNISWDLPTSDGFYSYDLKFFPGPAAPETITNVTIRSPQPPHTGTNCPDYVAEKDTVTCDCVTTDLGSPPSEIRWLEFSSHQLIVHNVTPDMNGTVYTCLQTWKSRAFANVTYTLHVTDKYTTISGPSPFIADGTKKMTLTCSTVNVNLEPTYNWTGVVCDNGNQGNMCSFTPRVPDDDGKIVTCTPSSNITSAGLASANFSVTLYYPPSPPVITGYNTSQVLTVGDSVSLTCTVGGGKPPISNITFYCMGQEPNATGDFDPSSSSSTITISSVKQHAGNATPCLCNSNGQWAPDTTKSFENLVKLTVLNAEAAMVTSLTLNNDTDQLIVNESDTSPIILRCAASGRPKPSIRVVRVDTGQPLEVDTSHTSGQDENVQQYTLTTSARCQDAAIYRCKASNRVGNDEENITLFVNCAPRTNQSTTLGITTKENETNSTSLSVVAYPQPNLTTVVFLGASPSSSNISSVEQRPRVLAAECGPTQELYVFNCTLTAIRPATSDQGFYNVTLENPYGEITQMVNLTVMSMSKQDRGSEGNKDTAESQFPLAIVAGGAGGAVVLLLIIAIIVVVVKSRKRAKYQSKETDQKHISVTSDDEFEEHVNCIYESSDGVLLTAKQQPGPSKPSATALALPPFTKLTDNDDEQETSFGYVTLKGEKPMENSAALGNRDRGALTSQCTDVADEYSTVDDDGRTFAVSSGRKFVPHSTAGRSSDYADVDDNSSVDDGSGKFLAGQPDPHTDMASDYADAGGYSSVKASGPGTSTSAQKTSRIRDDYAVVNKARKAKPDEYAQVNKASKRGNPPTAPKGQNGAKPTSDVYAQVQKSKPATKAKPGRETDGQGQGAADDEYNVLNFGDHQPTSQDIDEQYSHIKMSS